MVGDFGSGSRDAADVAALVAGWQPDFVVTTGDNNYPAGAAETLDANVGQFYSAFIGDYQGAYGAGSQINRFFPSLGNHDWDCRDRTSRLPLPYLDYFTLPEGPGEERYYSVQWGPVEVFAVDSDYREPDGTEINSAQAAWLRGAGRVQRALEVGGHARATLLVRHPRLDPAAALALSGVGGDSGAGRPRPQLRADCS